MVSSDCFRGSETFSTCSNLLPGSNFFSLLVVLYYTRIKMACLLIHCPPSSRSSQTLPQVLDLHRHFLFQFQIRRIHRPVQASRRSSTFSQGSDNNLVDDTLNWSRAGSVLAGGLGEEVSDDEDDEEDEEDRSLDLLVRFVQNIFRKISKRARRAVRSVLPVAISTKLVGFSVNGVIILAFLWILKAFLEVVCTLGSVVFVTILLIRGIWTGVLYLQESRNLRVDDTDDEPRVWRGAQPAS